MLHTIKIVVKTLMFVTVIAFTSLVMWGYNQEQIKAEERLITKPDFERENNLTFLNSVNQCVEYIYNTTSDVYPVNREILLAQAALESGWGNSRFSLEGKNLFGMRTYDLREPHMLPSNKPKKWGVKVYDHECDSVLHYIATLNNHSAYEDYREGLENNIDVFELVETLGAYASDENYFPKVKRIITKIREEYKLDYRD